MVSNMKGFRFSHNIYKANNANLNGGVFIKDSSNVTFTNETF